jgi:hypothetical protein
MFVVSKAFNLIDLCIVPEFNNMIYISTKIDTEQVEYIKDAINKFNIVGLFDEKKTLSIIDTKLIKHTRIEYGDSMGLTSINARLYSDKFYIYSTVISFRRDLVGESLVCVILHELLHSVLVSHNLLKDSIMNISISVDMNNNNIIQHEPCNLSLNDVLSILN